MRCEICSAEDHRVIRTVAGRDAASVRRRRRCFQCGHSWWTLEVAETSLRNDLALLTRIRGLILGPERG